MTTLDARGRTLYLSRWALSYPSLFSGLHNFNKTTGLDVLMAQSGRTSHPQHDRRFCRSHRGEVRHVAQRRTLKAAPMAAGGGLGSMLPSPPLTPSHSGGLALLSYHPPPRQTWRLARLTRMSVPLSPDRLAWPHVLRRRGRSVNRLWPPAASGRSRLSRRIHTAASVTTYQVLRISSLSSLWVCFEHVQQYPEGRRSSSWLACLCAGLPRPPRPGYPPLPDSEDRRLPLCLDPPSPASCRSQPMVTAALTPGFSQHPCRNHFLTKTLRSLVRQLAMIAQHGSCVCECKHGDFCPLCGGQARRNSHSIPAPSPLRLSPVQHALEIVSPAPCLLILLALSLSSSLLFSPFWTTTDLAHPRTPHPDQGLLQVPHSGGIFPQGTLPAATTGIPSPPSPHSYTSSFHLVCRSVCVCVCVCVFACLCDKTKSRSISITKLSIDYDHFFCRPPSTHPLSTRRGSRAPTVHIDVC